MKINNQIAANGSHCQTLVISSESVAKSPKSSRRSSTARLCQHCSIRQLSKSNQCFRSHQRLRPWPDSLGWTPAILLAIMLTSGELVAGCGPGRGGYRRRSPQKLTPLVFKQHIPNVSENTLGASGLSEGRITRDHKRFKELVPNYNPDIVFKDEEGTGADRLMTQRLKEKLNTLAISVMNMWPGVRLRVTEGWDEEGRHIRTSLHYEGRAVDITTSDRDRAKYGMLARLAVEAGFDWVYYESRFHIHCSVKSEKSKSGRLGGCFEEDSVVYGRNGSLPIKDVHIGDEILTVNESGELEYSQVLMFLDRDTAVDRLYYDFVTESGAKITTTPSHLLFVSESGENSTVDQFDATKVDFAKNIRVGQFLFTTGGGRTTGGHVVPERIISIASHLGHGAYAPLTVTGSVVVNNITASCYAVFRSQTFAHFTFIPIRFANWFIQFGDWLTRMLTESTAHFRRGSIPLPQAGIHWYAKTLYDTFQYFIPSTLMFN